MKKLYILLLSLFMGFQLSAAPVSRGVARQKALSFLSSRGMAVEEIALHDPVPAPSRQTDAAPAYYVFNAPEERGFVIVSGDDLTDDILGYSDHGTFDESLLPDNLRYWLQETADEMAWVRNRGVDVHALPGVRPAPKAPIAPMVATRWDQGAPYSDDCPDLNGQRCYSGCVATAMAQVMKFHQWPDTTKAIPAYTTGNGLEMELLPQAVFDWAHMKNVYGGNDTDTVARKAVATLMRYCGQATKMDYSPSGSGATISSMSEALKKYFNYNENLYLAEREDYSIADWADLIYGELADGRPVLYTGYSISVGHAFVCDGYDGGGLFHINWGWGGHYDGYFKLSVMNPYSTSGAGAGSTTDGYHTWQQAAIGVQKPGDDALPPPLVLDLSSLSLNDDASLSVEMYTKDAAERTYDCAFALETDDGQRTVLAQQSHTFRRAYNRWTYTCSFASLISAPGSYRIVPLCREQNDSIWRRVGRSCDYVDVEATSADGHLSFAADVHPIFNLEAKEMELKGSLSLGYNQIVVRVDNHGDEFNGTFYVFCGKDIKYYGWPDGYVTVALESGEQASVPIHFQVSSLKDFAITVAAVNGNSTKEMGYWEFEDYDLEILGAEVSYEPLSVTVSVRNNGAESYSRPLRAVYYYDDGKRRGYVDRRQTIAPGETASVVYDGVRLADTSNYYIIFQYQKARFDADFVDVGDRVDLAMQSNGIVQMEADGAAAMWHTLTGLRLEAPSRSGVYVRNRKKIIIK